MALHLPSREIPQALPIKTKVGCLNPLGKQVGCSVKDLKNHGFLESQPQDALWPLVLHLMHPRMAPRSKQLSCALSSKGGWCIICENTWKDMKTYENLVFVVFVVLANVCVVFFFSNHVHVEWFFFFVRRCDWGVSIRIGNWLWGLWRRSMLGLKLLASSGFFTACDRTRLFGCFWGPSWEGLKTNKWFKVFWDSEKPRIQMPFARRKLAGLRKSSESVDQDHQVETFCFLLNNSSYNDSYMFWHVLTDIRFLQANSSFPAQVRQVYKCLELKLCLIDAYRLGLSPKIHHPPIKQQKSTTQLATSCHC